MSHAHRRVPPPPVQQQSVYAAVPQSPRSNSYNRGTPYSPPPQSQRTTPGPRAPSNYSHGYSTSHAHSVNAGVSDDTAHSVQTGAIGGGYGPYSYEPSSVRDGGMYRESRFSAPPSEVSSMTGHEKATTHTTTTVPAYMWDAKDPDLDDTLHNPDPVRDAALDRSFTLFSSRGWMNYSALFLLVAGLILLFAGYPIISFYNKRVVLIPGFNFGGGNGTGQVPLLASFPSLIDRDTPQELYSKKGHDGANYKLVFSDEFNADGRSFYPGDDPYWEAVDLHYWATGDLEWYDPSAVTTRDGKLVITMTEQLNHDLNFMSGMLSTWNKFCFTTGLVEVAVSLPGDAQTPGLWPAAWTMGNLGRAGYGATTDGMWPYSYAACDPGTFPNQTDKNGNPAAAVTGAPGDGPLSYLPGQRLSACTCPGSDHPGPNVQTGRSAPEIDIFEAEIDVARREGRISQSAQVAPYNYQYEFNTASPATTVYDEDHTILNTYKGGVYQQAVSALTYVDSANYGGNGYAVYGFEWWSDPKRRDQGYITWTSEGDPTWRITPDAIGPDGTTDISGRLISEEPHYIILNLGMSPSFQEQDFRNLRFPVSMYIDYVRVYQKEGSENTGCNPKDRPTQDYINNHINAFTNPNLTTWSQAGYYFPRNSLYDNC